jgi:peptide/nickel transport system substrate-binding protein
MVRLRTTALLMSVAMLFLACAGAASPSPSPAAPASTAASASAAASPSAAASEAPKPGGTLVVGIPGDINRTDPSLIDDANSSYVEQQVIEPLVTLKPGTGDQIVGDLADTWTTSPDGLTYTFKLHPGVKFHDGTDLDAAAVKFNFDRWLNIPKAYTKLGYTYYIETVILGKIAKTEAPDSSTFAVTLKQPNSAFLVTMTLVNFGIQSPKALTDGKASAPDFKDNKYATGGPPAMVGTGPFKFQEWKPGDHVTLVKNDAYWNKANGGPYLDQVTFKPISDTTATLNAIQSNDIQMAQAFAPNDVKTIEADPNLKYYDRGSACNVGVLAMNQTHKPFDNPKIRQAVAYAVNRKAIVDAFFGETGVVLKNWVPPGTKFAKDETIPDYDPEKAKSLIAESGVTDLSFEFWYPSDISRAYMPDVKGEYEAIQSNLEAVGFKPTPKTKPWRPDYLAEESTGKYPMWLIGWNCDWLGIDNFLYTAFFGYRDGKPNVEFAYKNDDMNKAMEDALKASDESGQQQNWDKAQDLIAADLPTVPIVSGKTPLAARTSVHGLIASPTLLELFTDVWIDH